MQGGCVQRFFMKLIVWVLARPGHSHPQLAGGCTIACFLTSRKKKNQKTGKKKRRPRNSCYEAEEAAACHLGLPLLSQASFVHGAMCT